MRWLVRVGRLVVSTMLVVAEGVFWLRYVVGNVVAVLHDYRASRKLLRGTSVLCPEGHAIPTDDAVHECTACGYCYKGSIWFCPNPECPAPSTAHVRCPVCQLSIRNPHRWGRP